MTDDRPLIERIADPRELAAELEKIHRLVLEHLTDVALVTRFSLLLGYTIGVVVQKADEKK